MQATRKLAPFLKPYRLWAILAPFSAAQAAIAQPAHGRGSTVPTAYEMMERGSQWGQVLKRDKGSRLLPNMASQPTSYLGG
jgi:hypothetical protein